MAERRVGVLLSSAAFAVRLAWLADRRALIHVVLVQVLLAAGVAGGLVVAQRVFGSVLAQGRRRPGARPCWCRP